MIYKYFSYILLIFLIVSCSNADENDTNDNKSINKSIDASEFFNMIPRDDVIILDVRTKSEFRSGYIQGAVNYDINSRDFEDNISRLDKGKKILVYCLSGGRSATAANILASKGFSEVYNLSGGINVWKNKDFPIVQGDSDYQEVPGMTIEEFNKFINDDELVLINFNATWCSTCKKMAPILDDIAFIFGDNIRLVKIDADKNSSLLKQKSINEIPTTFLFKNGKLVWEQGGMVQKNTLEEMIKKHS